MKESTYQYRKTQAFRYTFTSIGKRRIQKEVVFTPTIVPHVYNLGFGDRLPDGSIDDKANSNNGDIRRILATLVHILVDFTSALPEAEVFFSGSTDERTRLYARILRTYFPFFSKDFVIDALIKQKGKYIQVAFDPESPHTFVGFFVRKKR
jgi:hypothetical protein